MGAMMPPPQRLFNMRSPFSRAILLAVVVLLLFVMTMKQNTYDVRSAVMKAANTAKQTMTTQHPLDSAGNAYGTDDSRWQDVPSNSSALMNCNYDTKHLKELQDKYELGEQFEYFKRYVKVSRQDIDRKTMTKLDQRFLPNTAKTVDLGKKNLNEQCPEPLVVPVTKSPAPDSANLTDFIFGVSTTYKRFTEPETSPINDWSYWLTDNHGNSNGGKMVLLLLDASDDELYDAWDRLHKVGIDADVFHSDSSMEMAVRYLTLVPTLYNHRERPNKKWLVLCDDDTFFPSPNALTQRLSKIDSSRPLYVGTFSEDVNQVQRHGSQAFGGAGVFISMPVGQMINELYETCKTPQKLQEADSGWGAQGDILLRKCIYENSDVRLTLENDLWQLDLYEDPSGFYESGIKPLSLHHYRGGGWHYAYPFEYTKIAHLCGEDCTMQRFMTEDDFVISTGYSIAQYPEGANYNWDQMERTFTPAPEDHGWNLDHAFGPQRTSLLRTGEKIAWDLKTAHVNEDGTITQIYVRKAKDPRWVDAEGWPMSQVDGVIELVWLP
ncbi:hypothetical protein N8I77_005812 [Diaporthe amygdali]|uniref:Fringe-like glycosyltransferase domain-containing protein n=2 Tax=Phomopsis amygdali TaxID=1214568 RepID=A0AAD9SF85_PHOAM|nr:hypothetical protein N8I77_005812 [Diaporthe amygdali]